MREKEGEKIDVCVVVFLLREIIRGILPFFPFMVHFFFTFMCLLMIKLQQTMFIYTQFCVFLVKECIYRHFSQFNH